MRQTLVTLQGDGASDGADLPIKIRFMGPTMIAPVLLHFSYRLTRISFLSVGRCRNPAPLTCGWSPGVTKRFLEVASRFDVHVSFL